MSQVLCFMVLYLFYQAIINYNDFEIIIESSQLAFDLQQ